MVCYGHHLRNDVACFPHPDGVANAHIQLPDKVLIVQDGTGYRGARQLHRLEDGRGGQHTGAPHRNADVLQDGFLFFRRIFERNGPPRKFVGAAHHFPLIEPVGFDHRAVNVIGQLTARLADPLNFPNGVLDVVKPPIPGRYGEPQALQIIQAFVMAGQGFAPHLLHVKHKNGQPPSRRDFAVFLPKGTGRRIARILKRRLIVQFLLFHQPAERRMRHINFSAHL